MIHDASPEANLLCWMVHEHAWIGASTDAEEGTGFLDPLQDSECVLPVP
jgi:hypothetical protein